MKKKNLDKIINLIREEGAPTMNTGSTAGKPGFSGKADAQGPVAGFDPVMKPKKKRYIWTRGIRKNWKKKGES
tara:strand:- start:107 stop:325 length:219 start_codon:yes stop_codon:yes gene_type:complete